MHASASLVLSLLTIVAAAPTHDHAHRNTHKLPSRWYHEDTHAAHELFVRDSAAPAVGSAAWAATYPTSKPDPSKVPAAWTASLNAAVAAGKIPSIPPSTVNAAGVPVYAGGLDPNGKQVCSATYKCRIPGDVWDAPDGVYALGFDDGPLPGSSDTLYEFLHNNSQHATHFMIGVNILANQAQFNYAFATLQDDIAVHTYTHPMMTTLSNEQVIAELGYTVQLIRDLTGGRLPRFWRPPFGDSDTRVRAIALEVFGLVTIIWNQDTEDWSIASGGTTSAAVSKNLQKWFHGPKSPGIIILEHELSAQSVQTFIDNYPTALQQGWKVMPVTELEAGLDVYRNTASNNASVTSLDVALASPSAVPSFSVAIPSSSLATTSSSMPLTVNGHAAVGSGSTSKSGSASTSTATGKPNGASRFSVPSFTTLLPLLLLLLA